MGKQAVANWCAVLMMLGCAANNTPAGGELGSGATGAASGSGASGGAGSGASGGAAQGIAGNGIDVEVDPNAPPAPTENCAPKIVGLLRDFQSPRSSKTTIGDSALATCPVYGDFQAAWQDPVEGLGFPEQGIPSVTLGPDRKPVFSGGTFKTTSAETFPAWYRDDEACTQTFEYELPMTQDPVSGNLVYDSKRFFPLDGRGFGTSGTDGFPPDGMNDHNFHFTFELHMTFKYEPGDVFSFSGDDDLWVFIDDQLVIDLGGAHAPMEASVELDSLGLTPGMEYPIDFFHAERAESQSNFHIETSLQFTNCDPIIIR